MELLKFVGQRIRELRGSLSQEALAKKLEVATNTVSRWETATYRPRLEDLEALSRVFGVSILEFFPKEYDPSEPKVAALLRAARDLPDSDLDELRRYAEFRKARSLLSPKKRGRKPGGTKRGGEAK